MEEKYNTLLVESVEQVQTTYYIGCLYYSEDYISTNIIPTVDKSRQSHQNDPYRLVHNHQQVAIPYKSVDVCPVNRFGMKSKLDSSSICARVGSIRVSQ
jgi:hypothetical protein